MGKSRCSNFPPVTWVGVCHYCIFPAFASHRWTYIGSPDLGVQFTVQSTLQWVLEQFLSSSVQCSCLIVLQALGCQTNATPSFHTYSLYCTALHCTALHCTALHCTALHCTALHCTALYCTALQCTALQCTALHYYHIVPVIYSI